MINNAVVIAASVCAASWFLALAPAMAAQPTDPPLEFQVEEGLNINSFVRQGDVAAHLVQSAQNVLRLGVFADPSTDPGRGIG